MDGFESLHSLNMLNIVIVCVKLCK